MGCDIHAAIEYRGTDGLWHAQLRPNKYFGKWDDEPEFTARLPFDRDYDSFSILANVRNGRGFAGCDTGDGFVPMTNARGLPEDISVEAREQGCTGDHSDTWVALNEILAYDWTRITKQRGWVSAEEFETWDRRKEWNPVPDSYCGGISGGSITHITDVEMRRHVQEMIGDKRGDAYQIAKQAFLTRYANHYCPIEWSISYAKAGRQILVDVLPMMLKLGKEHGIENVRLVMNFDS